MTSETVGPPEQEPEEDLEKRFPDEVRNKENSGEVENDHARDTDPVVMPPEPTSG